MVKQDYVAAWTRHDKAVAGVCKALRGAGLREHSGPVTTLPAFAYAKASGRSIVPRLGIVPRDLVVRFSGDSVSTKIDFTTGEAHSSLFRAVAYGLMCKGEAFLQVVVGGRALPIAWLVDLQGPIDPPTPTGIHGEAAFLAVVKAAAAAHRNPTRPHP